MPSTHPLLRRLERSLDLAPAEREAASRVPILASLVPADRTIVRQGDAPSRSFLLSEGLACTSKVVAAGRRQITAVHVPGDMPDLHSLHLRRLDSDIWAVTGCRVEAMPHDDLRRLCHAHPRLADELWKVTLVDASVYREWMASIAQRDALSRLAHLLCEMLLRYEVAGLARDGTCPLPLTQTDLSEMLGLSTVHVNRTLQELRGRDLVTFGQGTLTVHDRAALARLGDFRPDYLHLPARPAGAPLAASSAPTSTA